MNMRLSGLLAAIPFLLSSCAKVFDYVKDHPSSLASCCRIDSIKVDLIGLPSQHFHFLYNTAGQPIEIAAQSPQAINYQDYHFRYDTHGRLKDYLFTDGGGGTYVYNWDRYTYPSPNIIVDTTYEYQDQLSDPNPPYPTRFTSVKTLTQDNKGRTKRIIYWSPFYTDTTYIAYDTQGDVILPGVNYDNKVNWYQLNSTWQLLFGDYSSNNQFIPASAIFPASIPAYNSFGLPTAFQERIANPGDPGARLMFFYYTTMEVSYNCDTAKAMKTAQGL